MLIAGQKFETLDGYAEITDCHDGIYDCDEHILGFSGEELAIVGRSFTQDEINNLMEVLG